MISLETKTQTKRITYTQLFSSLQGEGPKVGEKHLFLRFPACNLHCVYCDEMGHPVHERPLEEMLTSIREMDRKSGPHHYMSLTGGEPLLYTEAIKQIAVPLRQEGWKFYLETGGVLVRELEDVLPVIDFISMDIKLPSVTKDRECWEEHHAFLKISQAKEHYVKLVISKETDLSEFKKAVELVADINTATLLVLQPMTVLNERSMDQELFFLLSQLQSVALRQLDCVRIIPRLHKILGIK